MMGLVFSVNKFFEIGTGGQWDLIWLPLCLLVILTSFIIYNVLLMFGKALNMRELERFAQAQMMQALATAFMAIFLVALVGSALELSRDIISGELRCGDDNVRIGLDDYESTMDDALDGVRCKLQLKAKEVASVHENIIGKDAHKTRAAFYGLNMMLSVFGVTVMSGDWVTSLYSYTETVRITNNLATVILIALNAQSYLVLYIKNNMLTIFLPIGILLRSFHFTRGVGALFIATAIGFYFVFPILFVMLDPGFVHIDLPTTVAPQSNPAEFCYPTMSNTAIMISTLETGGFGSTAVLEMDNVRDVLTKSYVSLLLHPLVALFLTLAFIRYLMTLLEGDTYELMKMVSKVI